MPTARPVLPGILALLATLGCDRPDSNVATKRVTLARTKTTPELSIVVPEAFLTPTSTESPEHPGRGYAIVGAEQIGEPDGFAGQVHVARYSGSTPVCHDVWVTEHRDVLELRTCAANQLKMALIPHRDGTILCWSSWHVFSELNPRYEALARVVDESCTTVIFD